MIDEKSIIPKSADDSTYVQMFYKAYHKLLYREARKYLNSTEDIDDIVQDSVVKLIENLDTIRSLSPKRQVSYAVTVTRNLAINLLIRQERITLESLDELEPYVKDSNDLEAQRQRTGSVPVNAGKWEAVHCRTRRPVRFHVPAGYHYGGSDDLR